MDIGLKLRGDKMDILTEATFGYTTRDTILAVILLGLGLVISVFGLASGLLATNRGRQSYKKWSGWTAPIIFFSLTVSLFVLASQFEEQQGYKAIIDDYNEVFENGYEIIGNEGRIYYLIESE